MKNKQNDRLMNWVRLENRLRKVLKQVEQIPSNDIHAIHLLIVRLDTILADETRRGYAISDAARESMAMCDLAKIEEEEWR